MINEAQLHQLITDAEKSLANGESPMNVKNTFLGRKGKLAELMKQIPELAKDERKSIGTVANNIKIELEALVNLHAQPSDAEIIDLSLPFQLLPHGHEHPIPHTISLLYSVFAKLGYVPFSSPEVETEENNFDFLRVAKDHPARDMQDTFWTTDKMVLRTHTTAFQHHVLSKLKPPFAVSQGGKVWRCEAEDATHLSELHQFDGFAVAEGLSFANLKGVLFHAFQEIFGQDIKIKFRPSFFPFVEPGAELELQCRHCNGKGCKACSGKGWLEMLGCGMTHPDILISAGLDPKKYQGIAFGMGVERLAMIKYGVTDIREFIKNDPRFLEQLT